MKTFKLQLSRIARPMEKFIRIATVSRQILGKCKKYVTIPIRIKPSCGEFLDSVPALIRDKLGRLHAYWIYVNDNGVEIYREEITKAT